MKKLKKILIKKVLRLIDSLPASPRGHIVRSQLNYKYPKEIYGEVTYKIAETESELYQAYKLVQDTYAESNLVDSSYSAMRITKYNMLPTTTVFIAKHRDEVVGTISQIMDTRMGLPIDGIAHIAKFRETGKRISEISSFAVKKEWRTGRKSLLLPLAALAIKYVYGNIGSHFIMCVVNKKAKHLYEDMFNCKNIATKDSDYQFVNCEPPVALSIDLEDLYKVSKLQYRKIHNPLRSFYLMITSPVWEDQINLPDHRFHLPTESTLKPEVIKRFFADNEELLAELSQVEKVVLHNLYFIPEFKKTLKLVDIKAEESRNNPRFFTNMHVFFLDEEIRRVQCLEVSQKAICIQTDHPYRVGDEVKVCINLNDKVCCYSNIKIMWEHKRRFGLYIQNEAPYMWDDYINEITQKYFHLEAEAINAC
jgi:hypothetical protein